MNALRRRPMAHAAAVLAAASVLCARAARAQEMAVPAVDDSPSAQLILEQAADQARANPREAVRLLVEALDGAHDRLVRTPADPDLFVTVAARAHAMLASDAALRTAFRREVDAESRAMLARGDVAVLVASRLWTEAGLDAALRAAEARLARGDCASALAMLDRVEGHDLLAGRRALHHAGMVAAAAARVGDPARAARALAAIDGTDGVEASERDAVRRAASPEVPLPAAATEPLGTGRVDLGDDGAWGQTWSVPIAPSATAIVANPVPPARGAPGAPTASPRAIASSDGRRVFVDDGAFVRAYERLSGRALWDASVGGVQGAFGQAALALPPRMATVDGDRVLAFGTGGMRTGAGLSCFDAGTGFLLWETRLDPGGARGDAEPLQPVGAPVVVDGVAVCAARRTTARLETVTWLVAFDLERPRAPAWSRAVASTGSARFGGMRVFDAPVVAAGTLYAATATGVVAAVDPVDGHVRWLRRFAVPIRDTAAAGEAPAIVTPAVVAGRVLAVSPDRSRLHVLDARDGRVLAEVPTGLDADIGTPEYLVGDHASSTAIAVGDRIACLDPGRPGAVRWSRPATGAAPDDRLRGRVAIASTGDPSGAVVAIPRGEDLVLVDALTGADRLRVQGAGGANPLLLGNQVVAVGGVRIGSWMPAAAAERGARDALAASPGADAALPLLQLACQTRSPRIGAEAADEAARRAVRDDADLATRARVLDAMLALDAADLGDGAVRASIDRAVDAVAATAGNPLRAALVRADRALRRREAREAARLAAAAGIEAPDGLMVREGPAEVSAIAAALGRIGAATAADPAAVAGVADAVDAAVRAAGADPRRLEAVQVRAAIVGAASAPGMRALESLVGQPGFDRARAVRLVRAARAAGAEPARCDRLLDALDPRVRAALAPAPLPPSIDGSPRRTVEFLGRLPRTASGVRPPPDGVLAFQGQDLVFRRGPDFAVAWRVPVGMADGTLIASVPDLVVVDDGPGGSGSVACVGRDGVPRWSAPLPERMLDRDRPLFDDDGRASLPSTTTLATAAAIVTIGRDGTMVGRSRDRGTEAWIREPEAGAILAWARDPLMVAVAREAPADVGAAVRLEAVDPANGVATMTRPLDDCGEVRWIRPVGGGLLVAGTDVSVEAHAPDDPVGPRWRIDAVEAQGTLRSWEVGRWLVVLDRFEDAFAIDVRSGRVDAGRFVVPSLLPSDGPLRDVLAGAGWHAFQRDARVDFFDAEGAYLGRDAPGGERSFVASAASARRLLALDAVEPGRDPVPLRFGAFLCDLDVRRGGLEADPPVRLRSLGQPLRSIVAVEGAVVVGNGTTLQAVVFAPVAAPSP
jgi:outer membrane protein assembly factor BamB